MIEIQWNVRLVNSTNARESRFATSSRAAKQRQQACLRVSNARNASKRPEFFTKREHPFRVTVTRFGPRKMDDDGVAASCKHVRDGIADALGVDDGDTLKIVFLYRQEIGPYSVKVRIE